MNYQKLIDLKRQKDMQEELPPDEEEDAQEDDGLDDGAFDEFLDHPKEKEELLEEVFDDLHDDEEGKALADLKEVFVSDKALFELLKELTSETNSSAYDEKLNKIANMCHHLKNAKKFNIILKVALFLSSLATLPIPKFPQQRELILSRLSVITSPDVINLAIEEMGADTVRNKEKYLTFFKNYGEHCIPLLLGYLMQKRDINTRYNIADAIAVFGKEALPQLEPWLNDNNWYVACTVISALGRTGLNAALNYLIPLLNSPDTRIQREVIKALGNIGSPDSLDLLMYTVKSADKSLLKPAIISIGQLQFDLSIPYLIGLAKKGLFKKSDMGIRKSAVIALGRTGSYKAIPPLLALLKDISFFGKDDNNEIRVLAAHSIAEVGGEEAIQALEIGVNSHNPHIKKTCKEMLHKVISKMKEEEED